MNDASPGTDEPFTISTRSHTIRISRFAREAQSNSAILILITASITAALAAVLNLKTWVPIAAAITAVISGVQIFRSNLLVPARIRVAEDATARVYGFLDDSSLPIGTAIQIRPNIWITAHHVVCMKDRPTWEVLLEIKGREIEAKVVYEDPEKDFAILSAITPEVLVPKLAHSLPIPGTSVRVIGWAAAEDLPVRHTLDGIAQGTVGNDEIVIAGPTPTHGLSGAPAIDMNTGKVVGLILRVNPAFDITSSGLKTLETIHAVPITALPAEFR